VDVGLCFYCVPEDLDLLLRLFLVMNMYISSARDVVNALNNVTGKTIYDHDSREFLLGTQ
jgi:hypothetical protein